MRAGVSPALNVKPFAAPQVELPNMLGLKTRQEPEKARLNSAERRPGSRAAKLLDAFGALSFFGRCLFRWVPWGILWLATLVVDNRQMTAVNSPETPKATIFSLGHGLTWTELHAYKARLDRKSARRKEFWGERTACCSRSCRP